MNQKTFNTTAMVVFIIAGSLHLVRSMAGWELTLGEVVIPVWLSLILVVLVAFLIYSAARLNKS